MTDMIILTLASSAILMLVTGMFSRFNVMDRPSVERTHDDEEWLAVAVEDEPGY